MSTGGATIGGIEQDDPIVRHITERIARLRRATIADLPDAAADAPAPVITRLSLVRGPDTGCTSVVIHGHALAGTRSVGFGGDPVLTMGGICDGQVTVITPAHVAGTVDVLLRAAHGAVNATSAFTYVHGPVRC